ncbi:cytochrome P450 family protein [Rhizoctonia solani]|uniref:Cytochrome P450 family protein n=1 Tax=Rhizoctonia solani TaxID=456999 RepID=A0A8H8P4I1_9AGAM|nr:cytochrome P450 family protein [Rhizoctonia solani]QRW25090.1 cytochrome P450 family protein [Rhizoctonia solani]
MLPTTPVSAAISATALWVLVRCLQMLYKAINTELINILYSQKKQSGKGYFQAKPMYQESSMGIIEFLMRNIAVRFMSSTMKFELTSRKNLEFLRAGKDAYMQVAVDNSRPNIYIADPQAIKSITMQKQRFTKDLEKVGEVVGMYGHNLASVEGDDWKRHRRETQRAFNEKNIRMVWSETEGVMNSLFEVWDKLNTTEVRISDVPDMTEMLALLVISAAGFGRRVNWDPADDKTPEGRKMSFSTALRTVSGNLITRLLIPNWAKDLTKTTRTITTAFSEFGNYLSEMTAARRIGKEIDGSELQEAPHAQVASDSLFNILLSASDADSGKGQKLSDRDVAGNAFLFLFAGHETTAHTLSFCLGLLALYPEVQQEVYEQIKQVIGTRDKLEYSDMNDINLVECVLWEALRLYPVVTQAPKIATEDSVISIARNGPGATENTREDFFIPKGANIWLSFTAVHYNPTHWSEPEKFRPKRFLEPYNKDAFLAFSIGPRSCLGRKFAETESIVALAMLLARYEVGIDDERFPNIPGESKLEREARLLDPIQTITLVPARLPLVFKRRL